MGANDWRSRDKVVGGQLVPATIFRSADGAVVSVPAEVVAAVQLAIRGHTWSEIARKMNRATKTVSGWMSRYEEYVEEQFRTLCAVDALINPLVPQALQVYRQALKDGDARVAGDVLDRAIGKPVIRVAEESHQIIEINVQPYIAPMVPAALPNTTGSPLPQRPVVTS